MRVLPKAINKHGKTAKFQHSRVDFYKATIGLWPDKHLILLLTKKYSFFSTRK